MATRKELDEQKALRDQQLALKEKQIIDAFNLSKSQLNEVQKEKEQASSQLAQQAYISKQQTERVMPDVLAAQGLARTGYVNTRQGQVNQSYKNQYGAIENDLNLAKAGFERQRALQELSLQQDKEALALERQAYELDYRQALTNLSTKGGGSVSSGSNNLNQIYKFGALEVENNMSPNQVDAYVQQYIDAGYMSAKDKGTLVNNLKNYAYTVNTGINQFSIPTVEKPKQAQQTESQKIKKALAVGQW